MALPQRRPFDDLAVQIHHTRLRRGRLVTGKPVAHVGQPNETPAADLQRRKFTPRKYSVNRSAAEPQTLSQKVYPDKRTLKFGLHVRLRFTLRPPFRVISLKEHSTNLPLYARARRYLAHKFFY
jgi:hypothetical protein